MLDLEWSLPFYRNAFGLEEVHRVDFPAFALVYLGNREIDFEVELTLNRDRKEPYAHGDGWALTARWSGHRTARSPSLRTRYATVLRDAGKDSLLFFEAGRGIEFHRPQR